MKILFATFDTAPEFLAHFEPLSGVVAVKTRAALEVGESCVVEIGFPGLPNRVLVRGRILSCEVKRSLARVELEEGQETKRDFLLRTARGEVPSWRRKHRRFPVRLPAKLAVEGTAIRGDGETEDLGGGGVFVRTGTLLPEHARVSVALDPCDGSASLALKGQVAWVRAEGGHAGLGVSFEELSSEEMRRLRSFMRLVKTLGKVSEWEDAAPPVAG